MASISSSVRMSIRVFGSLGSFKSLNGLGNWFSASQVPKDRKIRICW
jgi:hypothetical protein